MKASLESANRLDGIFEMQENFRSCDHRYEFLSHMINAAKQSHSPIHLN